MCNPVTELDKAVNKLRTKYRSYIVEYDVEDVGLNIISYYVHTFYRWLDYSDVYSVFFFCYRVL